jgi:heat-inducible transcriptional repressor
MLTGLPLGDVATKLTNFEGLFAPTSRAQVTLITESLLDQVDANRQEKIILAGTANLARREQDFPGSISPVLEAIEEQVVLLKLITEMQAEQHGVSLRIGSENKFEGLSETSVLVTGYENQGSEVAKLGVIGPTRMDYSGNIAAVRAVARYLTKILQG